MVGLPMADLSFHKKSDARHRIDAERIFASYQKRLPPDRRGDSLVRARIRVRYASTADDIGFKEDLGN